VRKLHHCPFRTRRLEHRAIRFSLSGTDEACNRQNLMAVSA
jgi:hypothetical protein